MNQRNCIPAGYDRIEVVGSLGGFFNAVAAAGNGGFGHKNAILFPRALAGAFNTLAVQLADRLMVDNKKLLSIDDLRALPRSSFGREEAQALDAICNDMAEILRHPQVDARTTRLRVIRHYNVSTVMKFHTDSVSRICCAFNDPVTEWVTNDDVDSGESQLKPGAQIRRFNAGDLWCHYGDPDDRSNAFIHRGPAAPTGEARLLLVSNISTCTWRP